MYVMQETVSKHTVNITVVTDIDENIVVLDTDNIKCSDFLKSLDIDSRSQILEVSTDMTIGQIATLPFNIITEYINTSDGEEYDVFFREITT